MLWRVADSNFTVLGAIHLSDHRLVFDASMEEAVNAADLIVFETNLEHQLDLPIARYTGGGSLRSEIPVDLFRDVRNLWLELGWDERELNATQPWWAAFRLQMAVYQARGFILSEGVDARVLQNAKMTRKNTFFLESANDSMKPVR